MATTVSLQLPLTGPGGETVDLRLTLTSHGLMALPPNRLDGPSALLESVTHLPGIGVRPIRIEPGAPGHALVTGVDLDETAVAREALAATARSILRLDLDLSPFYGATSTDPELAWVSNGYGRLGRCSTTFEAVIKTILTTNCAWSFTVRMAARLVDALGETYTRPDGSVVRAFPTAAAMARHDEGFYRETVRAGYRAKSLAGVATLVAGGDVDLEALDRATPDEIPDDEVRAQLLKLPGIGPYGAAHIMMMLGRPSRLILDSWTRPKYAMLTGAEATDKEIEARFAHYGRYAGLAFWLFVARDLLADEPAPVEEQS